MLITLAEALPLRVQLARKIRELRDERRESSTVVLAGEDDPQIDNLLPQRTMDEITEELTTVMKDYINLDQAINMKNISETITWKEKEICILSAINLAKEWRHELEEFKRFAAKAKIERNTNPYRSEPINSITKALFDPKTYKDKVASLERELARLSSTIEKKNHQVEFEFAAEQYMV